MNRGRVNTARAGGAAFIPPMVAGNVLWLRADQGVTLSSASVSNDTTQASNLWTVSNSTRADGQSDPASGTSAIKITDTLDGAPTLHLIQRTTITNMQDAPHMVSIWVKQGTMTWMALRWGGTTAICYINLATAVVGTKGALCSRATLLSGTGGGWQNWIIEYTSTGAATNLAIEMANADNGISYTGDGTGTIFTGTGATYGPVLYQDRVSAWADQSGLGNNGTQGTAASQMIYQELDSGGLWVPTGTTGSTKRIGNPADASKFLTLPASMYNIFTGDSVPETVIAIVQRMGTLAADDFGVLRLAGATATRDIGQVNHTTNAYIEVHVDDAALSKTWTSTRSASLTLHSLASGVTTTENLYVDGVIDPLSPRDVDVSTQTWNAASVRGRARTFREIAVYSNGLSNSDRKRVENGMRARWGLAPI